jgi:integrase/recombinase XerD
MSQRPKAPKHTYWRNGTLWARFAIGGREYRESLRTGDVKVGKARVEAMRNRAVAAAAFGENRQTWAQVGIEWAGHIAKQVSDTTALRYRVSLRQIDAGLKARYIDEISKADVLAIKRERELAGVSNATIRRDLQALSSVLDFAEMNDWRVGNPAKLIMGTVNEKRDPIFLPTEADYEFMGKRLTKPMADLMRAARLTGARISELVNMQRGQLDARAFTLRLIGKGNKARTIEVGQELAELVKSQPAHIECRNVFHFDGRAMFNAPFVFSKATRAAQKAAQKEGREFTGFRFHDLRHWFAVEWLRSGRSIYDLQKHLGHSTIATTEIYLSFLTVEEQENAKRPVQIELAEAREAV